MITSVETVVKLVVEEWEASDRQLLVFTSSSKYLLEKAFHAIFLVASYEANAGQSGTRECGTCVEDWLDVSCLPTWVSDLTERAIILTRSPIILSQCPNGSVFYIDTDLQDGATATPINTYGMTPDRVYSEVFGVSLRPHAVESKISKLFRLLDDKKSHEAKALLTELQGIIANPGYEGVFSEAEVLIRLNESRSPKTAPSLQPHPAM